MLWRNQARRTGGSVEQLDTGTAAALAIVCLIALVLILFSGGDDGDGTT